LFEIVLVCMLKISIIHDLRMLWVSAVGSSLHFEVKRMKTRFNVLNMQFSNSDLRRKYYKIKIKILNCANIYKNMQHVLRSIIFHFLKLIKFYDIFQQCKIKMQLVYPLTHLNNMLHTVWKLLHLLVNFSHIIHFRAVNIETFLCK